MVRNLVGYKHLPHKDLLNRARPFLYPCRPKSRQGVSNLYIIPYPSLFSFFCLEKKSMISIKNLDQHLLPIFIIADGHVRRTRRTERIISSNFNRLLSKLRNFTLTREANDSVAGVVDPILHQYLCVT